MSVSTATDDGILVERHRDEGHVGSFEILYRRYFPRLVRLLAARLRDRDAAEDLAQETLVRALTHFDRFDASRPIWPWLKTIALN
ncbi:MAG: RNA polymerase sigma factor, partial [Actinomycetota bacterium]